MSVTCLWWAASFHSVTISAEQVVCVVLCHRHLPLIAFSDTPPVPGLPLSSFVDPPTWAGSFAATGLRPLRVEELDKPMSKVDTRGLSKAEHTQIHYWRPRVLSDLLFNWWDCADLPIGA